MLRPYGDELWMLYYLIFNEANKSQRLRFFSEPLVQALWSQFVPANSATL